MRPPFSVTKKSATGIQCTRGRIYNSLYFGTLNYRAIGRRTHTNLSSRLQEAVIICVRLLS